MPSWKLYLQETDTDPITIIDGSNKGDWNQAPDTGVQYLLVFEPGPTMERQVDGSGNVSHVITNPIPDRFATGFVFRGWNRPWMIFTGIDNYDQVGYGRIKTGSLLSDSSYNAIFAQVLTDAAAFEATL